MTLDQDPQAPQEVVVMSVSPASPAERGMIKKGDKLLKIDGVEIKGWKLSQIAEKIVGPVGSSVTLSITSQGVPREVILHRVPLASLQTFTFPSPDSGSTLSLEERKMVKEKIIQLKTNDQRMKMQELLQAFKDKKISKEQFLQSVSKEF